MSNLNQRQVQKLLQKLSPQQIQMIKLLELPALQLEQRIKQEIEENPVLEEEPSEDQEEEQPKEVSVEEYFAEDDTPRYKYHANNYSPDDQKRPVAARVPDRTARIQKSVRTRDDVGQIHGRQYRRRRIFASKPVIHFGRHRL